MESTPFEFTMVVSVGNFSMLEKATFSIGFSSIAASFLAPQDASLARAKLTAKAIVDTDLNVFEFGFLAHPFRLSFYSHFLEDNYVDWSDKVDGHSV